MRISDWSSDVCSSDLRGGGRLLPVARRRRSARGSFHPPPRSAFTTGSAHGARSRCHGGNAGPVRPVLADHYATAAERRPGRRADQGARAVRRVYRSSEEHTSELQSLIRISYAVFSLKKKTHILIVI